MPAEEEAADTLATLQNRLKLLEDQLLQLPYLFAYKPIPAISRDPKLVTQNTDPMLTKKIQETLGYKPRPKNWAIYSNKTQKVLRKFPRKLTNSSWSE